MKLTPIASRRTSACFAAGAGRSTSTYSSASGPPVCRTRIAFIGRESYTWPMPMLALLLATYIPVAGTIVNSTTAYSTSFRITNRTAHRQLVRADWIARDGLGSHDGAQLLDLGPSETRMIA